MEEYRRQILHARRIRRAGQGQPDRQAPDARLPLRRRPRRQTRGPRSREGQRLRRARNERPARQPLRQLVRVEAQGAALRARRQRHRGQIDPEGGLAQNVALGGAAGNSAPRLRSADAARREDPLQHRLRADGSRRSARRHHAERVHAPHEGDGRHERRRHEPVLRSDARQLHPRRQRQPPDRDRHPPKRREGVRRQTQIDHQEDRCRRAGGEAVRGDDRQEKGGGAHRRGEKPARGVVEEGRHAAR